MAYATGYSVPQSVPPKSPRETLPTMYDLPSEFPEEPGLPDEFHALQPQLLARTLTLTTYTRNEWFCGSDLNLYYDVQHPLWHKRPDWFLAVGVPRLYDGHDMRRSYVVWQEGESPTVVVEFLSPGTEASDLGRFYSGTDAVEPTDPADPPQAKKSDTTPDKLTVYERYLRIPHYLVYSRHTRRLRYFQLLAGRYQERSLSTELPTVWLEDLTIGLGIWEGEFEGVSGHWLRWCDRDGNWLLTDTEQERHAKEQERFAKEQERFAKEQERLAKEQERLAREQAEQRANQLEQRLRELGIDPDQ
ncbi:MAG: Uma2 family endonuclease [Leptolyngbyaceae bacterium]|nr:Uma2 family endonuclease [Leptolyngbyaceae bacterium]